MDWSSLDRFHLWMGGTLFALAVLVVASAVATGIAVTLTAISFLGYVIDPDALLASEVVLGSVGLTAAAILGVVIWGERKAPAHATAAIGAEPVDDGEYSDLLALVRSVSQQADVPAPSVAVTPSKSPLSLATGFTARNSRLIVSEGLLDTLDGEQLEAVVAHEIAHVRNHDAAVMTAATFPIAAAGRVVELLSGPTTGAEYGHPSRADYADAFVTVGFTFVFPLAICAQYLSTSLSRTREFAADRGAVAITGNPAALAVALERIDETLGDRPTIDFRRAEVAAFAIVEPRRDEVYGYLAPIHRLRRRLFATHPDTTKRIEHLRQIEREQERA